MLAGFLGVVRGVKRVAVRHVRVVRGFDVVLVLVVLGGPSMMRGRFLVVLRRLPVVLRAFVLRHVRLRRASRAASRRVRI
jgi:hypothetical protein